MSNEKKLEKLFKNNSFWNKVIKHGLKNDDYFYGAIVDKINNSIEFEDYEDLLEEVETLLRTKFIKVFVFQSFRFLTEIAELDSNVILNRMRSVYNVVEFTVLADLLQNICNAFGFNAADQLRSPYNTQLNCLFLENLLFLASVINKQERVVMGSINAYNRNKLKVCVNALEEMTS